MISIRTFLYSSALLVFLLSAVSVQPAVVGVRDRGKAPAVQHGPQHGGTARWPESIERPASDPDSTWPMAASRLTGRWHPAGAAATARL